MFIKTINRWLYPEQQPGNLCGFLTFLIKIMDILVQYIPGCVEQMEYQSSVPCCSIDKQDRMIFIMKYNWW